MEKILENASVPENLKKAVLEDQKEQEENAKLFSVDEFVLDGEKVRTVYVPQLDRKVQYKKLTVIENEEIRKIEDTNLRGRKMLFKLLSKADSTVTEDKIGKLPDDVATAVLRAILNDFLL